MEEEEDDEVVISTRVFEKSDLRWLGLGYFSITLVL